MSVFLPLGAFFYDSSLQPVEPPTFQPQEAAFLQSANGQQGYVLAGLSAQWRPISRQSMNLRSSKWPTDSLSEVSHYTLLVSAGTHAEITFITPTVVVHIHRPKRNIWEVCHPRRVCVKLGKMYVVKHNCITWGVFNDYIMGNYMFRPVLATFRLS